jgi:uncharacterized protein YjbI with pentapeptide repeats
MILSDGRTERQPVANDEHLALLRKGTATWSEWRKRNPDTEPDLTWASLRGANLGRADLRNANLYKADLRQADLSGACLHEADLSGAILHGTDFSGARLYQTIFAYSYLTNAIGLDKCEHIAPSIPLTPTRYEDQVIYLILS